MMLDKKIVILKTGLENDGVDRTRFLLIAAGRGTQTKATELELDSSYGSSVTTQL